MQRIIKIQILSHRSTDLLMAVSHDLPGLVVHGRSERELEAKLPGIVKDLLEAAGEGVIDVSLVADDEHASPEYGIPAAFIANASLAAAHQ